MDRSTLQYTLYSFQQLGRAHKSEAMEDVLREESRSPVSQYEYLTLTYSVPLTLLIAELIQAS